MPLVVAAIITGVGAIGTAKIMADASDRAGAITTKGTADTIAFEKEKAAQDLQMANATSHANYDQWAAREGRMSSLGEMIGLPKRNVPAFQPIPGATSSVATTGAAATPTTAAATTATPGTGASASQAYFDSLFPGATLSPEMLSSQEGKLNAQGIKLLRNAAGRPGKILLPDGTAVDVIEGAGSGLNRKQWLVQGASSAPTTRTASTPYVTDPSSVMALGSASDLSPALSAPPPGAWQPQPRRSLGSYIGSYGA